MVTLEMATAAIPIPTLSPPTSGTPVAHEQRMLLLASGMTSIQRAKDLGDVVELVRHAQPARALGDALDPSVRDKYFEIWDALQRPDSLPE